MLINSEIEKELNEIENIANEIFINNELMLFLFKEKIEELRLSNHLMRQMKEASEAVAQMMQ